MINISVTRPEAFHDIKRGDSVACDGVCLTVVDFDQKNMSFDIVKETLEVTGWTVEELHGKVFNLERSLKFGERVHGHIVLGHVDEMGSVVAVESEGGNRILTISYSPSFSRYIWSKGSVAINGVSLTINQVGQQEFSVGLIPETLSRTNLEKLTSGDPVCLEADNAAKGIIQGLTQALESGVMGDILTQGGCS